MIKLTTEGFIEPNDLALNIFFKRFKAVPDEYNIYDVDQSFTSIIESGEFGNVESVTNEYGNRRNKSEIGKNAIYIIDQALLIEYRYEVLNFYYNKNLHNDKVLSIINKAEKFTKKVSKQLSLITVNNGDLCTEGVEIKKPKMNISKFYNDDFIEVDKLIRKRLNKKDDKGIVLLHGDVGTGKTSYLRYLISKVNKRVMYLPSNMANNITDPNFLAFLVNYSNSVLVIEDAENVILNRKHDPSGSGAVSNLLNLSDGLLSDCLNIQIVCTFNCDVRDIDPALTRKGRLISMYKFEKLSIDKAQALSNSFGYSTEITNEMTLTEIINQDDKSQQTVEKPLELGFKRY